MLRPPAHKLHVTNHSRPSLALQCTHQTDNHLHNLIPQIPKGITLHKHLIITRVRCSEKKRNTHTPTCLSLLQQAVAKQRGGDPS